MIPQLATRNSEPQTGLDAQILALRAAAQTAIEMADGYTKLAAEQTTIANGLLAQIKRLKAPERAVIDVSEF